jgi:hypothetical protein
MHLESGRLAQPARDRFEGVRGIGREFKNYQVDRGARQKLLRARGVFRFTNQFSAGNLAQLPADRFAELGISINDDDCKLLIQCSAPRPAGQITRPGLSCKGMSDDFDRRSLCRQESSVA